MFLDWNVAILKSSSTKHIESETLSYVIKYITQAIKNPRTYSIINPLLPELLTNYVFPLLFITQADALEWDENPDEFTRKMYDISPIFYTPRTAALDMITIACSHLPPAPKGIVKKTPDSHPILTQFIQFLLKILAESDNSAQINVRAIDSAFLALGSLVDEIEKFPSISGELEGILKQFVLKQFKNQIGFVRMRACWVYGQFYELEFKDVEAFKVAIQCVFEALSDSDLPVRVVAAVSLHKFLDNNVIVDMLRPVLAELLTIYLKLMNEIELEELVFGLEQLVKAYGDEIKPFALRLTQELVDAFKRMSAPTSDEDIPDSALAASACVDTINKIIQMLGPSSPEIIDQIEPVSTK